MHYEQHNNIFDEENIMDIMKNIPNVPINMSDESKKHKTLSHYCDIKALGYILNQRTIRCTALNHTNLNDQFESKRKNIERFAGSIFIACFSHSQYEIVPFWINYGGQCQTKKVMLKFKKFSESLEDVLQTDYCLSENKKRILFYTDKLTDLINDQTDDKRSFVKKLEMVDIKYRPINDEVFKRSNITSANLIMASGKSMDVPVTLPGSLGKYKTIHWDYEQETRIICTLTPCEQSYFSYIDLRLKDEIFRDLQVVISPWAESSLKQDIQNIIASSTLDNNIKQSIQVKSSELHGQIKI